MKKIVIPIAALLLTACHTATPDRQEAVMPDKPETAGVMAENKTADPAETAQADALSAATATSSHSSFNGILIVPPQHLATVTLTMGGTVRSMRMLPGDYVKKGALLVTLENPEFIDLQQTFLDAHAQTEYLASEYQRQQRLSAQEAASQKRFQQSKADYLSMRSRMEAAAAQLSLLNVSTERLLKSGIQPYLEIKAPLDGYIARLSVNMGKYVNAGEPICDVINKGETLLCLTAYEKDLTDLSAGNSVRFRVNGMGEQTFEGQVISIGQEVDAVSRSLEVYVRMKENNSRFRPGMYVSAQIEKK